MGLDLDIQRRQLELLAVLAIAVSLVSADAAAQQLFYDGFEAPEVGFSNWSFTSVDGANALTQSTDRSHAGTQAMKVSYAGDPSFDMASAGRVLSTPQNVISFAFWLYFPLATQTAMTLSSRIRLLRLADSNGAPLGELSVERDAAGNLYLGVIYQTVGGTGVKAGTVTSTPFGPDAWIFVALTWEPARLRLFINDAQVPKVDVSPPTLVQTAIDRFAIGCPSSVSSQGATLTYYIDDVWSGLSLSLDGGSDAGFDGGADSGFDGGVDSGFDGGVDSGFDGGSDAGFDGGADAGFDGGSDAGFDGGADAGFDGGADAGFDGGSDAGFDGGSDAGFGPGPQKPGYYDVGCSCGGSTGGLASALLGLGALVGLRRRVRRDGKDPVERC